MGSTWAITLIAGVLFTPLFMTQGLGRFDFWWWMSTNLTILLVLVTIFDRHWWSEIRIDIKHQTLWKVGFGILSALFLYIVFYAGNIVSRQIFSFAKSGIENVYAFKSGVSPFRIAVLMVLLIGPGEELFWRGFLQRRLQMEQGRWRGFIIATSIYTLVHLASGNAMLILAAGLCGLFWGFLYVQKGSILLNIVSHTVWDVAIFLLFPVIE
ncbi:MAG TPA: CPBP family intramembrane metalloprotease [Desulfobacterales bacterium]|nr:CPBP family intramembrane metalloprotease [Desulfobacterales bacterium]